MDFFWGGGGKGNFVLLRRGQTIFFLVLIKERCGFQIFFLYLLSDKLFG